MFWKSGLSILFHINNINNLQRDCIARLIYFTHRQKRQYFVSRKGIQGSIQGETPALHFASFENVLLFVNTCTLWIIGYTDLPVCFCPKQLRYKAMEPWINRENNYTHLPSSPNGDTT